MAAARRRDARITSDVEPIFAGGLVWSTGWRGTGLLYGLDPSTGAVRFQTALGTFAHFATPSAGGGRLFVAAGANLAAIVAVGASGQRSRTVIVRFAIVRARR